MSCLRKLFIVILAAFSEAKNVPSAPFPAATMPAITHNRPNVFTHEDIIVPGHNILAVPLYPLKVNTNKGVEDERDLPPTADGESIGAVGDILLLKDTETIATTEQTISADIPAGQVVMNEASTPTSLHGVPDKNTLVYPPPCFDCNHIPDKYIQDQPNAECSYPIPNTLCTQIPDGQLQFQPNNHVKENFPNQQLAPVAPSGIAGQIHDGQIQHVPLRAVRGEGSRVRILGFIWVFVCIGLGMVMFTQ